MRRLTLICTSCGYKIEIDETPEGLRRFFMDGWIFATHPDQKTGSVWICPDCAEEYFLEGTEEE